MGYFRPCQPPRVTVTLCCIELLMHKLCYRRMLNRLRPNQALRRRTGLSPRVDSSGVLSKPTRLPFPICEYSGSLGWLRNVVTVQAPPDGLSNGYLYALDRALSGSLCLLNCPTTVTGDRPGATGDTLREGVQGSKVTTSRHLPDCIWSVPMVGP